MFNFSGSELVFLLLLALIILGPEKLPEAIRKFGQTYAEFKKVTTGFQTELKQALDEPVKEMRQTAELFKQAATFDVLDPKQTVVPAPQQNQQETTGSGDAGASTEPGAADTGAAPPLASAAADTSERSDTSVPVTGEPAQRMRSLDDIIVQQPFGKAMTTTATAAVTESGEPAEPSDSGDSAPPAESAEPAPPATSDATTGAVDDGTTPA